MGGLGSGRRLQFGRDTVDEYRHVDLLRWHREGLLAPRMRFTWTWSGSAGRAQASIRAARTGDGLRLSYAVHAGTDEARDIAYVVPIAWTPCHYGGQRPWFVCPGRGCGRRVLRLYLRGGYFLCRHCHDLTYVSRQQRRGHPQLLRAQQIRARLGGHTGLSRPFPEKPKGMHRRTYLRLWEEARRLEREGYEALDQRLAALAGSFVKLLGG